jgi:putative MATE family efflux protein
MYFFTAAVLRGAGDSKTPFLFMIVSVALDIAFTPLLIFGVGPFPEMGVTGAAVGTTIGRLTGALFALAVLLRPGARIHLAARHLVVQAEVMWRLVKLSAAGTFQIFVGSASWILLIRIVSTFGSDVIAGYGIAIRIVIFALLPSWGVSNAAATMVGQALGAGKPERAEKAVWIAGKYNAILLGSVGLIFVLFAPAIVHLFSTKAAIASPAIDGLRVISAGFLFYAYGMVVSQSFNGAGDTWTPTWMNVACFWLWEIPLGWFLAFHAGMGLHGVYLAIAIAYATLAVLSVIQFRRGKWKMQKV